MLQIIWINVPHAEWNSFVSMPVAASREAIENAGLDMEREDPFRVGVCVSSSVGSLQIMEKEEKRLVEKGPGRVGPLACTDDDFQYGFRKRFNRFWVSWKISECGNGLRYRKPFDW